MFENLPGIFRLHPGETFHICGPVQEPNEFALFSPQESKELEEANLMHFDAGIGLNSPTQVRTPPGGQMMAAGCIPKEPEDVPHTISIA